MHSAISLTSTWDQPIARHQKKYPGSFSLDAYNNHNFSYLQINRNLLANDLLF